MNVYDVYIKLFNVKIHMGSSFEQLCKATLLMRHTEAKGEWPICFREEDFEKCFT